MSSLPRQGEEAVAIASDLRRPGRSRRRCSNRTIGALILLVLLSFTPFFVPMQLKGRFRTSWSFVRSTTPTTISSGSASAALQQELIQDYRRKQQGKPIMLLHAGPPKTGTTFLQKVLQRIPDILAKDNFTYIGTAHNFAAYPQDRERYLAHGFDSFFVEGRNYTHDPQLSPFFLKLLHENRGRNAIIVWEAFDWFSVAQIQRLATILNADWQVRVILTYRRVFDFLPSLYNENVKPFSHRHEYDVWPGERKRIDHGNDNKWTEVTGQPLLPFDIYHRGESSQLFWNMERHGLHPVVSIQQVFRPYFPDVTILPMHTLPGRQGNNNNNSSNHGTGRLLQAIACHTTLLPTTGTTTTASMPHTCASASNETLMEQASRGGSNSFYTGINFDILAVYAYQHKLLLRSMEQQQPQQQITPLGVNNTTTTTNSNKWPQRRHVVDAIRRHQLQDLGLAANDFPLRCLPQQALDRLLNVSLRMEEQLFSNQEEQEHRLAFANFVETQKIRYCSINVEQTLLQRPEWKVFLATL